MTEDDVASYLEDCHDVHYSDARELAQEICKRLDYNAMYEQIDLHLDHILKENKAKEQTMFQRYGGSSSNAQFPVSEFGKLQKRDDGRYVEYTDVAEIEEERDAAVEERDKLKDWKYKAQMLGRAVIGLTTDDNDYVLAGNRGHRQALVRHLKTGIIDATDGQVEHALSARCIELEQELAVEKNKVGLAEWKWGLKGHLNWTAIQNDLDGRMKWWRDNPPDKVGRRDNQPALSETHHDDPRPPAARARK